MNFVAIIIPQSYGQRGFSLLEDHTSEIICPQNRENPLGILPNMPVLLPVSALYGVKVPKYVICMVVCKCANHSFGLNYSLWLLQNNMKFLIKHDVCFLGVACLYCIGAVDSASCDHTTRESLFSFTVKENSFA